MFGYPTGIGALLARREALKKLHRPWFAGGTITVASVQGDKYYLAEAPAAFEDGTLDYLNIPAVEIGLKHIQSIGYETIHERVRCLTGWLLDNLSAMKHTSGVPLVRIYGPLDTDQARRGGDGQFLRQGRQADRPSFHRGEGATRPTSPCGQAASATPARARSPWASPGWNWPPASPSPATTSA